MWRQSVSGLGVVAAVCMSAVSANAQTTDHIDLRCSVEAGLARRSDPPWINTIAMYYRIDLSASAVNGDILHIDQRHTDGPKLSWHRPADASVPAAHYVLDIGTGSLFVSFDRFEYDGRKFGPSARRLRCTNPLLKIAV
jgi:hypothetical protein